MNLLSKIALMAVATIGASQAAPAYAQTQTVTPIYASQGKFLLAGDSFVSADGRFKLTFQGDGNLVLYQGTTVLWDTNTVIGIPTGGYYPLKAQFQTDGNLVVYWFNGTSQVAVWDSNTHNKPLARMVVQNDGNLVIYNGSKAIWDTNTCCH